MLCTSGDAVNSLPFCRLFLANAEKSAKPIPPPHVGAADAPHQL